MPSSFRLTEWQRVHFVSPCEKALFCRRTENMPFVYSNLYIVFYTSFIFTFFMFAHCFSQFVYKPSISPMRLCVHARVHAHTNIIYHIKFFSIEWIIQLIRIANKFFAFINEGDLSSCHMIVLWCEFIPFSIRLFTCFNTITESVCEWMRSSRMYHIK